MSPETDLHQQFFDMLMHSQYWPAADMAAYQQSQLEQLLRHARAEVPFYERRLDPIFRADGSIDWGKWQDLPILTRGELVRHGDAMRARVLPKGHGNVAKYSSSGSTGPAVTVWHSESASMAGRSAVFRAHRWHDVDWSLPLIAWMGDDPDVAVWPVGSNYGHWGPPWVEKSPGGEMLVINRATDMGKALEFISRNKAAYLTGRPKSFQALALAARRLGLHIPLRGLLAFSTGIADDERADCTEAFGAKIWSAYSSKEANLMAYQCPSGTHFHASAEISMLEILDEAGRPVPPGEMGRVVVTPFFNAAQPLIRYDQGDLAIAGAPCNCARTLPVIERIVGRSTNLFRFPDGTSMAPWIPEGYRTLLGAQYWQVAQIGPLSVEIRYVPAQVANHDEAAFAEMVRQRIRPDLTVSFRRLAGIGRIEGGKFIEYVCELRESAYAPAGQPS